MLKRLLHFEIHGVQAYTEPIGNVASRRIVAKHRVEDGTAAVRHLGKGLHQGLQVRA